MIRIPDDGFGRQKPGDQFQGIFPVRELSMPVRFPILAQFHATRNGVGRRKGRANPHPSKSCQNVNGTGIAPGRNRHHHVPMPRGWRANFPTTPPTTRQRSAVKVNAMRKLFPDSCTTTPATKGRRDIPE